MVWLCFIQYYYKRLVRQPFLKPKNTFESVYLYTTLFIQWKIAAFHLPRTFECINIVQNPFSTQKTNVTWAHGKGIRFNFRYIAWKFG